MPQFETITFNNTIIDAKQILDKQKDVRTIAFIGATKPFVTQSQAHESGYQLVLELNNGIRMLVLYQPGDFTVTVKGVEFVPNERSPEGFRLPVLNKCIPAESFMNRFAKLGAVLPEQPTASPTDEPKVEQPDWELAFYDQIVALGYNAILNRGGPSEIHIRGVGYDFMELLLLSSEQIVSRHRGTRYTRDQVFAGLIALRDRREQRKVAVEQALLNKPDWFVDLMNQITDLGLNVMPFKSEGGTVNSLSISNDNLSLVAHCTDIDCITIEGMRGVISRKQLLYFLTTQANGTPTDEPKANPTARVAHLAETLQGRGYHAFAVDADLIVAVGHTPRGERVFLEWIDEGNDELTYLARSSSPQTGSYYDLMRRNYRPDDLLHELDNPSLEYVKYHLDNEVALIAPNEALRARLGAGHDTCLLAKERLPNGGRNTCHALWVRFFDVEIIYEYDRSTSSFVFHSAEHPTNAVQRMVHRDFAKPMHINELVRRVKAYWDGSDIEQPTDEPVAEPTAQPSDTVTNAEPRANLRSMSPDEIVKAFGRRGVHASFDHGVLAITGAYEGKPYASDCYIRATVIGGTKWKLTNSTELGLTDKELFDRYPCTLEYFAHRLRYDVRENKPPRLLQISYDIDNQELLIGDEAVDMVARFKFQYDDDYGYTEIQPVATTPVKNDDQKLFYSVFANKGNAFWYNSLLASICAYLEKIVHLVDEPAAQPTATPIAIDQLVAVLRKRGIMASYDGDLSIVRCYDLQPDCTYKPIVDVWMCATVSNGTTLWLNDEHGALADSELLARYQITPDYFVHRLRYEMKLKELPTVGMSITAFALEDGQDRMMVLDEHRDMVTKYLFDPSGDELKLIPTYTCESLTEKQICFWDNFHKTHTYDSLLASICAYLTYA